MEHEDIKNLIAKYQDGTASQEERLVVDEWYNYITKNEASKPVDFDLISAKDTIWSRLALDIEEPKKNKSLYLYVASRCSPCLRSRRTQRQTTPARTSATVPARQGLPAINQIVPRM